MIQLCPSGVRGRLQVAPIDTAVSETYIFASSLWNFSINTLDHMKKFKDNALVGNNVHFDNVFVRMKSTTSCFIILFRLTCRPAEGPQNEVCLLPEAQRGRRYWTLAVTVFARSVARKCCYRHVSQAKEARVFHDIKPMMGDAGSARFGRCAGLPTAMRHDEDPANFPDIILDPAKDGIYISLDRSRVIISRDSQWLAHMLLVLACSLANVIQLRPSGVDGWLQVKAIEIVVSD